MSEMCTDNRFEVIAAYKKKLMESTNIETSPDEMAVIDNVLFRFWQMGWLPPVPHGRLIDADAYRAEMKKRQDACAEWRDDIKDGGGYGTELYYRADSFLGAMCEAKMTLDKMPTIISAEEDMA